ncbi:MAG: LppA family lipoprotein [Segniliparus sp.]|uniref:LppA family lipoprotein n=1 Tax=Segniliparus sp. TaxID=2804064 RepID=UPI003F2F63DD
MANGKSRLRPVPYVIVIAAAIGSVVLCVGGYALLGLWGRQLDPNYSQPEEVAAHEAALRQGGPAEEDAKRVEAALARAADEAVGNSLGLTWRWGEQAPENSTCDPYNMFHGVKPVRIVLRHVVFEGTLTGPARERAAAALKTQAEALGLVDEKLFTDSYGRSWAVHSKGSDGAEAGFVSGQAASGAPDDSIARERALAVFEGKSACLFPQQYFAQSRAPVPSR